MTHAVTHEQKKRGGNGGIKRIHGCGNPAAKPPKSSETVYKASLSNLHTQEVTGSSPAVSTKKFLISYEIRNFFCLYPQIVTLHFGVFRLTQTVTQKPRDQESTGEGRMASSVPLRLFFVDYMVWLMTLPMVSAAERFISSVAWV